MKSLVLACLLCSLAACSNGVGNANSGLAGNWQFVLTNTKTGALKYESGFFLQSGYVIAGNVLLTGSTVCPGTGSAQGQIVGNGVSISVDQVQQTVTLAGTWTDNGTEMSGNYSILASPCGTTQVGTWAGYRVAPLTGIFRARFTSTTSPAQVIHFSGTVTQGPNLGNTATSLSGSMTSSDSSCFGSASITGQISGTSVVFNLSSSQGASLGQFGGIMTLDATSITGTYNFQPQSTSGCANSGTVSVSVQPT